MLFPIVRLSQFRRWQGIWTNTCSDSDRPLRTYSVDQSRYVGLSGGRQGATTQLSSTPLTFKRLGGYCVVRSRSRSACRMALLAHIPADPTKSVPCAKLWLYLPHRTAMRLANSPLPVQYDSIPLAKNTHSMLCDWSIDCRGYAIGTGGAKTGQATPQQVNELNAQMFERIKRFFATKISHAVVCGCKTNMSHIVYAHLYARTHTHGIRHQSSLNHVP